MSGAEPDLAAMRPELAASASPTATAQERAAGILRHLGRILPFDAGWLAMRDPERQRHVPLATTGPAAPLHEYFGRAEADEEVDQLNLNRRRRPMLASEIPIPLSEVPAWAEHLLPAGFREGLAAPLVTTDGRHIGFLSLLSADPCRPSQADRRVVAALTQVIADDLDRTRDIAETARIIQGASAGVVLTRGGDVLPLPGLPDDCRLTPGSPLLSVAADELANSGAYTTFLAPTAGADDGRLVRVTALDFACPDLDHLSAAVLLCPPGNLQGLAVLDLRVLGLLVEGVTDISALGPALRVSRETVADSLGRSLATLRTSDLTAATVRALRGGMRIPPGLPRGS
jgi:hypothetical protein